MSHGRTQSIRGFSLMGVHRGLGVSLSWAYTGSKRFLSHGRTQGIRGLQEL